MLLVMLVVVGGLLLCALGNKNLNEYDTSGLPGCAESTGKLMLILAIIAAFALLS